MSQEKKSNAPPDAPTLQNESDKSRGLVNPPSGLGSPLLTGSEQATVLAATPTENAPKPPPPPPAPSVVPVAPRRREDALKALETAQRHPRTNQAKCRVEAPGTVRANGKLYNHGDEDYFDDADVESLPGHLIPIKK